MGTEKQERHANDHDVHPRERAASTDAADVIQADKAANTASAHQRKHAGKEPVDERYGEGSKANVNARIIKVEVADGRTKITLGAGHDQGIRAGMEGYIKVGAGMLADFQIESTQDKIAVASVDLTPEAIYEVSDVVVNPSSKPAPATDIKGRIIGVSIEGDFVKIAIGLGAGQGVRAGMKGFMHSADNDRPYADFVVGDVHPRICHARVHLNNLDEVQRNELIVLNPASATAAPAPGAKAHHP